MKTITLEAFTIVGIAIRTTNEQMQAATDIPALWKRFFEEGIAGSIQHKADEELYCLYTDYESDFTKPYTAVLGYRVTQVDMLTPQLTAFTVPEKTYRVFTASGNLNEGAVFGEWTKIWNTHMNRAYTGDFEIYGAKAQNTEKAEVDIFIALTN